TRAVGEHEVVRTRLDDHRGVEPSQLLDRADRLCVADMRDVQRYAELARHRAGDVHGNGLADSRPAVVPRGQAASLSGDQPPSLGDRDVRVFAVDVQAYAGMLGEVPKSAQ